MLPGHFESTCSSFQGRHLCRLWPRTSSRSCLLLQGQARALLSSAQPLQRHPPFCPLPSLSSTAPPCSFSASQPPQLHLCSVARRCLASAGPPSVLPHQLCHRLPFSTLLLTGFQLQHRAPSSKSASTALAQPVALVRAASPSPALPAEPACSLPSLAVAWYLLGASAHPLSKCFQLVSPAPVCCTAFYPGFLLRCSSAVPPPGFPSAPSRISSPWPTLFGS